MIYEFRNYHFRPDLFEAYKAWAGDRALPYLRANLNIVGFWVSRDIPPEINGAAMDDLGSANIRWIIAWESMDQRAQEMPKALASDEWNQIFADVPGGIESYLRMEANFMEAL